MPPQPTAEESVPLSLPTLPCLQECELFPGLDAFHDHAMVEAFSHADHGADDRAQSGWAVIS